MGAIAFLLVAAPAFAQSIGSPAGFNPQDLLRSALQWIESLGIIGGKRGGASFDIRLIGNLPNSAQAAQESDQQILFGNV